MADEIVCSAWRHAAARKGGDGLTTHSERLALLLGTTGLIKYLGCSHVATWDNEFVGHF